MSIEAIHYVMKTAITDGIAKLVAFVIADYAHAETGEAWPKIETLARKCSQSVRTVQRKIRVLEDIGVLRVDRRHSDNGRQRENLYVLYLPGVPRPAANDLGARADPGTVPAGGMGDTQSPIPGAGSADPVTLGGDCVDTPEGDTAVTPRGIPQKESTSRESPKRETPSVAPPPASADAATAPKGAPSPRATLCPDHFAPDGRHYALAEARGFDPAFVREVAASMHRWSHANAHRPIARKADWSLAFDGILETALREAAARAARRPTPASTPSRRSSNGMLSLAADMMGVPDEPADILAALGFPPAHGPGHADPRDGSAGRGVPEPAGGRPERLPPEPYPCLAGARR